MSFFFFFFFCFTIILFKRCDQRRRDGWRGEADAKGRRARKHVRQSERGCFSFGDTSRRKRHSILLFTRTSDKDGMALASDCAPLNGKAPHVRKRDLQKLLRRSRSFSSVAISRDVEANIRFPRSNSNQSYLIARSTSRIKLHPIARSLARSLARYPLPAANGAASRSASRRLTFSRIFEETSHPTVTRNRPIAQVSRIFQSERRASRRVPQLRRD